MAPFDLPDEDRETIRTILLNQKAEGVEHPLLPMDVDVDGDGIADAWGIDENDEVVFVPGVPLEDTMFRSDGDGIVEGR